MASRKLNLAVIGVEILSGQHARYARAHADTVLKAIADLRTRVGSAISQ